MPEQLVTIMSQISVIVLPLVFIGVVALAAALYKLIQRVDRFMGAKSGKHNIEAMLLEYLDMSREIDSRYAELREDARSASRRLSFCVCKVGLVRYNPFKDMGGDLCFALALLDDHNDGVVINTLHARESSYTYCKEIVNGKCDKAMASEEEEAIAKAIAVRGR